MSRRPAPPPDAILMARIGAAHGIRGAVRLNSFTADPLAIAGYAPLLTDRPPLTVEIAGVRRQGKTLIATLSGVADRDAAEALTGVGLYVPRAALPATGEPDEFYHADLIGLDARLPDGQSLGMITAIFNHGAEDILQVSPEGAPAILVPFTRAVVPLVDIEAGFVTVAPPPGLLDDAGDQEPSS